MSCGISHRKSKKSREGILYPQDVQQHPCQCLGGNILKEKITKISGQAEAERIYNYPYAAVEEVLSNAIYHKSYQIGEPITVTVTPDQMEITSLPGPDRTISDEDIQNRRMISRRYRNRRIGDFLKELKLVEGRNTGIPTILRAMETNGSHPPLFETDAERTYFTVILPVHETFLHPETPKTKMPLTAKPRKSIEEIKSLILKTLDKIGDMPTSELAAAMGYTKVTAAVSKVIKDLMSEGKIIYSDPKHPHSRNQKICLMEDQEGK